nr:zinc finger BED domain-containing protein RICESLEEPER 2-like [Quercus suber]
MKYLKGLESRMCRFDECARIFGMKRTNGLCLDMCTRWNATYDMIDSAMRCRFVLNCLAEEDANFKHCPSRDEWNRVERITRFLKPFNDITTLFFGIDYPTTNLYFQGVSQIELLLLEEMESQDSFISNMAEQMKVRFDKYWDCYSVVLAYAIVLDPRYKLDYVDYIFKKIEPIEHIAKMKNMNAPSLWSLQMFHLVSSHTSGAVDDPDGDEDKEDDEFDHYESGRGTKTKKSQMDLYLEEFRLDKKQNSKLEVLSWWKEHYNQFLELSLMARDLMSIPIITVASESNEDANEIGQLELQFASMNICSAESATNVE